MPAAAKAQCAGSEGYAAQFDGRRTFLWQPAMLAAAKARLESDPALMAELRRRADAALAVGPFSVTDKTQAPPSGDRHDYRSLAPYWWPSAGKRNSEPYERRDGRINPERGGDAFDLARLQAFSDTVRLLALAHYHTGDARYAERAAVLIRAWFVDPATRMNPNMSFAQGIPGRVAGRAEGIIDASRLVPVVEAIGLLEPSGTLTAIDREALRDWFGALVRWMATSPNGRAERAKTNNHGIYYDMLIAQFALFAGLDEVAAAVTWLVGSRRIETQFAPDGTLPEELKRTRSWHYTLWTLVATARLAQMGRCVGVDIAAYRGDAGSTLPGALDAAAAIVDPERDWPHPDIAFGDPGRMEEEDRLAYETFASAAWYLENPAYAAAARRYIAPAQGGDDILYLGPPPVEG